MADYEIIDNYLPQQDFEHIKNILLGKQFPWHFLEDVAEKGKVQEEVPDFYGIEKSDFFNKVAKLIHPNHNFNIFSNLYFFTINHLRKEPVPEPISIIFSKLSFSLK